MPANKRIESDRPTRCAASPAPHPTFERPPSEPFELGAGERWGAFPIFRS